METKLTHSVNSLGSRILSEMARQKLTGFYFTFRQRQQLRSIDDRQELRRALARLGCGAVDTSGDEQQIIEAIGRNTTPSHNGFMLGIQMLMSGLEMIAFGSWVGLIWTVGMAIFLLAILRAKRKTTESASPRQSPADRSGGVVQ
jgi:hypothetical protein